MGIQLLKEKPVNANTIIIANIQTEKSAIIFVLSPSANPAIIAANSTKSLWFIILRNLCINGIKKVKQDLYALIKNCFPYICLFAKYE